LGAPAAWPAARRRPPAAPAAWPARQRAAAGPWAARDLWVGHQRAGGPELAAAPTAVLGRRAAAARSRAAAAARAAGAGRPAAPRPRLSARCPRAAPAAALPLRKAGARLRRCWPDPSAATRHHPPRRAPVRGAHGPFHILQWHTELKHAFVNAGGGPGSAAQHPVLPVVPSKRACCWVASAGPATWPNAILCHHKGPAVIACTQLTACWHIRPASVGSLSYLMTRSRCVRLAAGEGDDSIARPRSRPLRVHTRLDSLPISLLTTA